MKICKNCGEKIRFKQDKGIASRWVHIQTIERICPDWRPCNNPEPK